MFGDIGTSPLYSLAAALNIEQTSEAGSAESRGRCSRRTVWQEEIFAAMVRNASHVTDYFRLPSRQVVEIGRQISI